MTYITALKALQDESTKAGKDQILRDYENNETFRTIIEFIYNPYKTIGISTKKLQKVVTPQPSQIETISELLDYVLIHNTGDDHTLGIVRDYLGKVSNDERPLLEQVLTKSITLGISAKSINKVYGKNTIPTFDVQLAFPYEKKIDKYADDEKLYCTQKLDGYRAITICQDDSIVTYSRNGQVVSGLSQMHEALLHILPEDVMTNGVVLDGELLLANTENLSTSDLFRATSKVLRKDGEKENIEYHLFDIIQYDEFVNQDVSTETYEERRQVLDTLGTNRLINIVPVLDIITKDNIPTWSAYATDNEWEGVMLNRASGLYKKTRSPDILKVKQMHTADLEIVGFNEAIDGKFAGKLQSINVKLDENNIVQVGSGLTEEVREEIWNNQEKYIGVMVEIQYFELSENQNGGKSLRFPVFKDFRFDKTPEDSNVE